MIKVCNRAPNPIQVGNITIPGFSSVLLDSFSSTMETNRLMNKGLLSVYYVPNEVGNTSVKEETKVVKDTITEDVKLNTISDNSNNTKDTLTEEVPTTTRKRGRSKLIVDTNVDTTTYSTTETNTTKGDIEYASDND